ncbi:MAG: hypothetical protein JWM14_356 [Chitinophagaceae bacterium]|nr:hypothetical protein [Chitinophagaceae bacterium]
MERSTRTRLITILLAVTFIGILVSCQQTDDGDFTDYAILQGYIQEGHYFTLTVSRQVPFADDVTYSSDDINNLIISVDYNSSTYVLTPLGNGMYIDSSIIVNEGDTYHLSFVFNNQQVSAITTVPYKPVNFQSSVTELEVPPQSGGQGPPQGTIPEPVILTWNNTDATYYIAVIQNMETNPVPITSGTTSQNEKRFRTPPTALNTSEIRPLDFTYYGMHRIILYHVLPDYAFLYTQNNSSSQNLTSPSSAITNGYGIFTGLNSDTLFIDVNQP